MTTTYSKPAVRSSWGLTATGADLTDPGDTYASKGWQLGVKPPRQYFNWVLNYTFAAVRYLCQQGISDWDLTENYVTNAIVQGSDNRLYQALQASTGVNPVGGSPGFWGPIQGATPSNTDHSNSLATTAWVNGNYLAIGSTFAAIAGSIAPGQVPVGAVTQWQGSLSIGGGQVSSAVSRANAISLGNGNYATLNYANQQAGQPTWVFGSSDGLNVATWNPTNFSVANAAQLAGFNPSIGSTGLTVAVRDATGQISAQYFFQASPNNENPSISQVMVTNGADGFLRKAALSAVGQALNPTTIGSQVSSTLPGGVILKVGSVSGVPTAGQPTDTNIVFSPAFPTACVGVWPTTNRNVAGSGQAVDGSNFASNISKNGATITIDSSSASWLAIGY